MSDTVAYLCEKDGCGRVVNGATRAQALDRMARHWTANDHQEFVDKLIENEGKL